MKVEPCHPNTDAVPKTAQADSPRDAAPAGWVLYDGDCPICIATVTRWKRTFVPRGLAFAPLQTPWVRDRIGWHDASPPKEMLVITPADTILGGADALAYLARRVWWTSPIGLFARVPGVMYFARAAYRRFARNRTRSNCSTNTCGPGGFAARR